MNIDEKPSGQESGAYFN